MSLSDCSNPIFGGPLLVDNSAFDVTTCGIALFGGPFVVIKTTSTASGGVTARGGALAGGTSLYQMRLAKTGSGGTVEVILSVTSSYPYVQFTLFQQEISFICSYPSIQFKRE